MSSIPISYGAVSKVRKQWDAGVFRDRDPMMKTQQQNGPSHNALDHPPAKYNDKLMNSIWGLYNQYAPPSFQKNFELKTDAKKMVTLGGLWWNQQNN